MFLVKERPRERDNTVHSFGDRCQDSLCGRILRVSLELVVAPDALHRTAVFLREFADAIHFAILDQSFEHVFVGCRCKLNRGYAVGHAKLELALIAPHICDVQSLVQKGEGFALAADELF